MTESSGYTRRDFLGIAAVGAALPVLGTAELQAAGSSGNPLSPAELKKRLRGPIMAIPTPFTKDSEVDYDGVRNMIRLGLDHGIVAYELTSGDSQFHCLSYDEIKQLTCVLVETVGGKGIAIGCTSEWWTKRAVEYARFCEEIGADGIQIRLPRGEEDGFVQHVQTIADSTKLGLVLQGTGPVTDSLLGKLSVIPSFVGLKEDKGDTYYFDWQRKFGDRLAIFCGGQKWRFLTGHEYGSMGYLTTFGTFAPTITTRFWDAIEKKDLNAARGIVLKYDAPFFDMCLSGKTSFQAYWRATLAHFGVAQPYLRAPEASASDEVRKEIAAFFDNLGLKP